MCIVEQGFRLTFLFVVWNISSALAQDPPRIENLNSDTIFYCSDSVPVTPYISIQNIEINEANEGMKISIANYKRNEDILVYDEIAGFDYNWVEFFGYLEIKGSGSAEEYQAAVRKVYYKNIASVPNLENRSFSISLLDADYLPQTKHFYRYVKKTDITWKEARDSAANLEYYGLKGYLATITSYIENDFIWTKIDGIGWIGASDEESEGAWKWVTGPEAGTHFWQGEENGTPVNNEYSNWASGTEPNNSGDEDFAHINQNPNKPAKSWNDLKNGGDGPNSQYYRAQGFIVEFGGLLDEPELKLSASAVIKISKIAFADERDFEICQGDRIHLNNLITPVSEDYSYTWLPRENIDSPNVPSPFVSPTEDAVYWVTGELGGCITSVDFNVVVKPIPVHTWEPDTIICEGVSIELNPGEHTSYLWENLETDQEITVSNEGWYSVIVTNEFECSSTDSTQVKWSVLPKLDYGELDTLVCGSKQQKINLAFENGDASTNLISLNAQADVVEANTLSPTITVDEFGIYSFQMEVRDQYQCNFLDTLNVEFHNQPEAKILLDEEKCQGYNLDLSFVGLTLEPAVFSWFTNDSIFAKGSGLTEIVIPLGYGQRDRTVGLKVNEQGCIDSVEIPVTVTPLMNFWVEENPEGCTPLAVEFGNSDVEDIAKYSWDFGDGDSASVEKPSHIYSNAGVSDINFDVKLTVLSAEGCENTGVLNNAVTVHPIPTIDLNFEENVCYTEMASVSYRGSGNSKDTYLWDLSNFQTDEILQNPGNTSGPFEFSGISNPEVEIGLKVISEFGCETEFISKLFKRKPIFSVELDKSEGCPALDVKFTATTLDSVDVVDYNWDFGDGKVGVGETVSNEFLQDDKKYDIEIVAKSDLTACSDTLFLSEEVFVYPQPKAVFTPNPNSVLISNPVILFENTSEKATFYEWDFDDNSVLSVEESPTHRFSEMGFFDVKLTAINDFACTNTMLQQVSVAFDKLYPPTAFSPNATKEEDREFRIYSVGIVNEGYQLLIFNRWGEVIFESESQDFGWNGKMKNENFAPAGVYTWVIQYLDFRGEKYKQQGTVTLLF